MRKSSLLLSRRQSLQGLLVFGAGAALSRDKVDGPKDKDQGIEVEGRANFVPSTKDAIAFTRTPQEVLRIVYSTDKDGADAGGIYPKGMNGNIKTT
jgi:hypothetical protein